MESKIAKIGISQASDQALDRILTKANEGFTGGRITKSELASWIILYFESHAFENNLDKLRKDHFDQVAYLESVVREIKVAKKTGAAAPDLHLLLAPVTSALKAAQKKKEQENG